MKYQYVLFTLAGAAMAGGPGGYGSDEHKGTGPWDKPSLPSYAGISAALGINLAHPSGPAAPLESPCDEETTPYQGHAPPAKPEPSHKNEWSKTYPEHPSAPSESPCDDEEEGKPQKSHAPSAKPAKSYPDHPSAPSETPCESDEPETPKETSPPAPYYAPHGNDTEPITTGLYTSTYKPTNYSNPSNTYTPAQQTANLGSRTGPATAGVFGLAAVAMFLL